MRSCAETLKTKILLLFTILEACRPPLTLSTNRLKIDVKMQAKFVSVFGSILERTWTLSASILERFGSHVGAILDPFWIHFGAILGASWGILGHLGGILGHLGSSWGHLGHMLGHLEGSEPSWGHLVAETVFVYERSEGLPDNLMII